MHQLKFILILFKVFLTLILFSGLFFSNLPKYMSEFNQLDVFWSVPVGLQALIILSSVSYLFFFRRTNGVFLVFLIIATVGSWYSLTVSNATNNVVTRVGGIPIQTVEFQDIEELSFNRFTVTISGASKKRLFIGLYPLGLNYKSIKRYFVEAHHCVEYEKGECVRVEFD